VIAPAVGCNGLVASGWLGSIKGAVCPSDDVVRFDVVLF
jgi:hypothetical protein